MESFSFFGFEMPVTFLIIYLLLVVEWTLCNTEFGNVS